MTKTYKANDDKFKCMKVSIKNAANYFFKNPKLELVYFEAIANAIDQKATQIDIKTSLIKKDTKNKAITDIEIDISDNGIGFTDENYKRFGMLLESMDNTHKGIGRLVYLSYFKQIMVDSIFDNNKRTFSYNNNFNSDSGEPKYDVNEENKTTLYFREYQKDKIHSFERLSPDNLKNSIMTHFFPLLYNKKMNNEPFKINISLLGSENYQGIETIDYRDFEDLKEVEIKEGQIDLIDKLKVVYSLKKNNSENTKKTLITGICSDGRTIKVEFLKKNALPVGYSLIFIAYSNFFDGKSDPERENLNISESDFKIINQKLSNELANILSDKIPEIKESNEKEKQQIDEKYPHLVGYYNKNTLGLLNRNEIIEESQKKFFSDQREILETKNLTPTQYEKALNVSARVLLEYILYRSHIIKKLEKIDNSHDEGVIHNLIVPKKKQFEKENISKNFFNNNAWILDDKYMNYQSILSDLEMSKIFSSLNIKDDPKNPNARPDIAIIISSDIEESKNEESKKVDVVIVELKKKGLKLHEKEKLDGQLRERSRELVVYYSKKIQRIWFYGVIDFDKEFIVSIEELGYVPIYSNGSVYYKEYSIKDQSDDNRTVLLGIYLLNYEALIEDAKSRNNTFLNVLKSGIKEISEQFDNFSKTDKDG